MRHSSRCCQARGRAGTLRSWRPMAMPLRGRLPAARWGPASALLRLSQVRRAECGRSASSGGALLHSCTAASVGGLRLVVPGLLAVQAAGSWLWEVRGRMTLCKAKAAMQPGWFLGGGLLSGRWRRQFDSCNNGLLPFNVMLQLGCCGCVVWLRPDRLQHGALVTAIMSPAHT